MMKSVLDVAIGDQLTGELEGVVTDKFSTMDTERNRCVALILETSDGWRDAILPVTAVVAVRVRATA